MAERVDLPKLRLQIDNDYYRLQPFRERRRKHVELMAGSEYGEASGMLPSPVNMLSLYTRVVGSYLVGSDPRFMATTFNRDVKPLARVFQDWGNDKLKKDCFADVMRKTVTDAFFLMGINKVCLTKPIEDRIKGDYERSGEASIYVVDFEDFGFDLNAKHSFKECSYMWNRYEVYYDDIKASPLIKSRIRSELRPYLDDGTNKSGDEKIGTISRGRMFWQDDYEERVELVDVWIPRLGVVVTYCTHSSDATEPILVTDWIGPKYGPFHILSFGDVPGQLIPKAPILDYVNLHTSINHLWTKVDFQATRQKKNVVYDSQTEDAERARDAVDGDWLRMGNAERVKELSLGGPDQQVSVWLTQSIDTCIRHMGNLYTLGGLAVQSQTVGQDKLLSENASKMVNALSLKTVQYGEELIRAIGWYWWNHPDQDISNVVKVPSIPDISTRVLVTPEERVNFPFEELDLVISPHSWKYNTPESVMMLLEKMLKEVFIPLLPMFNQPGVGDLLNEYVKQVSELANVPQLQDLLDKLVMTAMGNDVVQEEPKQDTTTTHERVSRPGMTDRGHQQQLEQMLAGGERNGQVQEGVQ